MHKICKTLLLFALILFITKGKYCYSQEKIPAFPGAVGAGAYATGGRGGEVYIVTNLNKSGPGSFADAVSEPNRIVVFAVSGTIDLARTFKGKKIKNPLADYQNRVKEIKKAHRDKKWTDKKLSRAKERYENELEELKSDTSYMDGGRIAIDQPNITIAGQTAPGEGITLIHGSLEVNASNVIVRYIRVRRGYIGNGIMGDCFTAKGGKEELSNIIFDHLSAAWATDENLTVTGNINKATAEYCIAAQGCDYYDPRQTPPRHSEGSLFGSDAPGAHITFDHIVYADNRLRNPRLTGSSENSLPLLDETNCLIFNWVEEPSHTGSGGADANFINNYFKPGQDTWNSMRKVMFNFKNQRAPFYMYADGNYIEGYLQGCKDNWLAMTNVSGKKINFTNNVAPNKKSNIYRVETPFPGINYKIESAEEAYNNCLENAGDDIPSRDFVDVRILRGIKYGGGRVIQRETDFPDYRRWPKNWTLPAPVDKDRDGLPDYWEKQYGLNINKNESQKDPDHDGYVNIEEYFNNTDPTGGNTPIVFISAYVSRANKYEETPGILKITRNGDLSKGLPVEFSVSGTAKRKEDYIPFKNNVVIPAGKKYAFVKINTFLAGKVNAGLKPKQKDKSVILTLKKTGDYNIGCPHAAMVVIQEY